MSQIIDLRKISEEKRPSTHSINSGQASSDSVEAGKLNIIGGAECPSAGVNKGVITSIEEAVTSISSTLEKAERMTGLPIGQAYVGISGKNIVSQESQGVVAVAKADKEIREDDVERSLAAAQTVATPPNYEIIHVIPRCFKVDKASSLRFIWINISPQSNQEATWKFDFDL